ncbi:something about silencing protein 10 [Sitophilus oryzae]|uniref:Something about silencing protein 10 n=1 Tax=Sitophilus oryzae TaxID=7048 RepID=A0A6J2XR03_SITOR|nr:something about silencing protein 10 [Sitophilus oryzae]
MDSDIRFNDNDMGSSSSDDEYDENEKRLLKKYRGGTQQESESENEVLSVGSNDSHSDSDNESNIALSDVEGQESDELPDVRAWGKEKRKYYGTDYVDPDYGGFNEKDAQAAEIEEEEAKNLQNQLVQQLDDNDFSLDVIFKKKTKQDVKEELEEVVKRDLSLLSNKQKIQLLQKESPEFFQLIEDFKVKMEIAKNILKPAIDRIKDEKLANESTGLEKFVTTYYNLILNYSTNIYMYLILKINKQLNNHPIIKALYQYRQLLSQMEPVFEEIIKPQIDLIGRNLKQESAQKPKAKKVLKILSKNVSVGKSKTKVKSDQPRKKLKIDEEALQKSKKVTFEEPKSDADLDQSTKMDNDEEENAEGIEEAEDVSKRAITYQMAKNKGLTPHRKKELRNPRVKHRQKYRKALIRRKGAVREPRRELTRYAGEVSGIKASLSKSIKIKS